MRRGTLHPTPYTLHPIPYTLHPEPCTLCKPYTLNPEKEWKGEARTGTTMAWYVLLVMGKYLTLAQGVHGSRCSTHLQFAVGRRPRTRNYHVVASPLQRIWREEQRTE